MNNVIVEYFSLKSLIYEILYQKRKLKMRSVQIACSKWQEQELKITKVYQNTVIKCSVEKNQRQN